MSTIKQAYKVIDSVMQEVLVAEDQALQDICSLLESENLKFKSNVIEALISVLKQWNAIPVNETRERIEEIKGKLKSIKTIDKS
jgi:hypothetical protein